LYKTAGEISDTYEMHSIVCERVPFVKVIATVTANIACLFKLNTSGARHGNLQRKEPMILGGTRLQNAMVIKRKLSYL